MAEQPAGAEDLYRRANALLNAQRFNEALALDPSHADRVGAHFQALETLFHARAG